MDFTWRIAEQRIEQAQKDGLFDNLAGRGEPLRLADDRGVPSELRMSYKILKNAGMLPPELLLRKELLCLEDLLRCCEDDIERQTVTRKLNRKRLQLRLMLERTGRCLPETYNDQVQERLQTSA